MTSYVLWSNKGGIGKSTLTFHVACAYARENPSVPTYIVDLSPQCDVSRMALGGGGYNGEEQILEIMNDKKRRTVAGYLQECHATVPTQGRWPKSANFSVQLSDARPAGSRKLPENLHLVCGDFDLERTVALLTSLSDPPQRGGRAPSGPQYSADLLVRSYLRNMVEQIGTEATFFYRHRSVLQSCYDPHGAAGRRSLAHCLQSKFPRKSVRRVSEH